jgi:ABC-2 type transport system ATP-binding protein
LDPRSRIDLWAVIEQLVAGGTTLLLTTQYLEEADRLADQICVVDRGRVIAEGTAAELKATLGGTVVEVVLASPEVATQTAELLRGAGEADPVRDENVVRVATAAGPATLTEVVRRLDSAGIAATGLQLRQPSLDDVFLSLTGHGAGESDEPSGRGRRKRAKEDAA